MFARIRLFFLIHRRESIEAAICRQRIQLERNKYRLAVLERARNRAIAKIMQASTPTMDALDKTPRWDYLPKSSANVNPFRR